MKVVATETMYFEKPGKRFASYKTEQNWGKLITNLYIDQAAFGSDGPPKQITVTVTVEDT
jgi:hypothetical protein